MHCLSLSMSSVCCKAHHHTLTHPHHHYSQPVAACAYAWHAPLSGVPSAGWSSGPPPRPPAGQTAPGRSAAAHAVAPPCAPAGRETAQLCVCVCACVVTHWACCAISRPWKELSCCLMRVLACRSAAWLCSTSPSRNFSSARNLPFMACRSSRLQEQC